MREYYKCIIYINVYVALNVEVGQVNLKPLVILWKPVIRLISFERASFRASSFSLFLNAKILYPNYLFINKLWMYILFKSRNKSISSLIYTTTSYQSCLMNIYVSWERNLNFDNRYFRLIKIYFTWLWYNCRCANLLYCGVLSDSEWVYCHKSVRPYLSVFIIKFQKIFII